MFTINNLHKLDPSHVTAQPVTKLLPTQYSYEMLLAPQRMVVAHEAGGGQRIRCICPAQEGGMSGANRSAGFKTCCAADFQVGIAAVWPADLETRGKADLEVCATLFRTFRYEYVTFSQKIFFRRY
jgi:hypothetical protein